MEKLLKENGKFVILWAVMIVAIIVVLVSTNSSKSKKQVATNTKNENTYVQTEAKEEQNEEQQKTEVVLSQSSIVLAVGSSETLTIKEGEVKNLKWTSTNPSIASVSDSGNVTAVSMGTAIITGQLESGEAGNCTIIVTDSGTVNKNTNDSNPPTSTSPNSSSNKTTQTQQTTRYPNTSSGTQSSSTNKNNNNTLINNKNEINKEEEKQEYTVTFMIDNKVVRTKKVEKEKTIGELPSNPSKYGYTFDGWYSMGQKVTPETKVNNNITIVGRWDTYTFEEELIENDEHSPNRVIVAYKNGRKIGINAIYGTYEEQEDYTLGIWSEELANVKIVSSKQLENSTDYIIELSNGLKVYANA